MVYIFLATGFEEMEALITADMMRRAGIDVKLCGVTGEYVTGARGITVKSDVSIDDVNGTADMMVLPGGLPGVDNLWACDKVRELITEQYNAGKYVAAICAAPSIFGKLGMLEGKRAICYPGFEDKLTGAKVEVDAVVSTDGNVITSKAAGTTFDFAHKLTELLVGIQTADKIRDSVYYKSGEKHLD